MKRLILSMAIGTLIFNINCSKIPENNDPVIGIWSNEGANLSSSTNKQTSRKEWIFNDAYLGRYHSYTNKNIDVETDFKWTQENHVYTISYPGTNMPDNIVTLEESQEVSLLKDAQGNVLAIRE